MQNWKKRLWTLVPGVAAAFCADAAVSDPAAARAAVQEWVAVEQTISSEETTWKQKSAQLQDRIAVMDAQIDRLEAELARSSAQTTASDTERLELLEREATLNDAANAHAGFVTGVEEDLRAVYRRLPEPLREELSLLYQKLPDNAAGTELGLGERFQTVVGILMQIRQFNNRVALAEVEAKVPGSGENAVMRVIYFGLGQAFYLAPGDAGIGKPTTDGWEWQSKPELESAILEVLQIADGRRLDIGFVELPLQFENREAPQ